MGPVVTAIPAGMTTLSSPSLVAITVTHGSFRFALISNVLSDLALNMVPGVVLWATAAWPASSAFLAGERVNHRSYMVKPILALADSF